eukprot:528313-Pelagomonas_calceolata.AAC.3
MRCQRPNKVPCRSNLQPCSAANALRTHRPPNYPRILTFSSVNGAVQVNPLSSMKGGKKCLHVYHAYVPMHWK